MQLTYQKLGKDHPMFGKVTFLVADGTTPICYKTENGYIPLEEGAASAATAPTKESIDTQPLYVLSFKVNDEAEEMTFKSKKKLDKTVERLNQKPFVTDLKTTTYNVVS
ncbi:hypothetical protein GHNINEIG_02342 [Hydrogenovibrio crunogenus]|uniref:Uncharacterized protein n=1 Tax=Hydrogenovibrio crunogenus TaxID=39765 RepID=A0A4V1C959_9GAMM|nr:hypothetical protein [Hydrogenovibrio crunogenus]QBZ84264.1 hypothetical protein GHNINEIG_02342 [Hydrogenovibrio crunogenus]RUM92525.1 MAG: hypothetical protein DSZ27_03190 [Thiomicrospira sp.]